MRRAAVVAAASLLVLAAPAAAGPSPAATYRAAIAAAGAQRSVHYVALTRISGTTETMVGDAARDRGSQRITYTRGGSTGHVTIVVVRNTAYVRGDRFALGAYLGLTTAQATRYAGRWFSLVPPGAAYGQVAEAVRLQSFVAELRMPGPYRAAAAATIGGRRVAGVRTRATVGGKPVEVTLYVGSGSPLPVAQGPTGTITTTLGRWNEHVGISAPTGAIRFR